jgi:hypothetical protein
MFVAIIHAKKMTIHGYWKSLKRVDTF